MSYFSIEYFWIPRIYMLLLLEKVTDGQTFVKHPIGVKCFESYCDFF